jgi:hypothetical protein
MEYLMTYGWAILIVIVVVAALYAMGVFKVGAPGGCSPCFGSKEFTYLDHGDDMLAVRVGPRAILNSTGSQFNSGDTMMEDISTQCPLWSISGDTCDVTLTYTVVDSGIQHDSVATLYKE